ncbi:hypothetical protein T484DRAFT_1641576, partial [Baffinella frigidus]
RIIHTHILKRRSRWQINVLVTTPLATRGLDFPAVTHVFNLGLVGSAADYLHRAGRAGRIGQVSYGWAFELRYSYVEAKILIFLSIRCILGDIRLWVGDPSTSSRPVSPHT